MKKRYLILGLIVLGVWAYLRIGMAQMDYVIAHIAYPGVYLIHRIKEIKDTWMQRRRSTAELVAALEHAQQTITHLSAEIIALRSTALYLDDLREVQRFRHRYTTDWMLCAQVIHITLSPDAHIIILDRGSRHGVERNMVAVYHNSIVGRVSDVYPWWCKVTLITDKLSKIPVICAATQTTGIFEGTNDDQEGTLSYVSHLSPLQQGDMIITTGDGLIYPRGFAVGTITAIHYDADKLHYKVRVAPLYNPHTIRMCYLMLRGAEYDNSNSDERV